MVGIECEIQLVIEYFGWNFLETTIQSLKLFLPSCLLMLLDTLSCAGLMFTRTEVCGSGVWGTSTVNVPVTGSNSTSAASGADTTAIGSGTGDACV